MGSRPSTRLNPPPRPDIGELRSKFTPDELRDFKWRQERTKEWRDRNPDRELPGPSALASGGPGYGPMLGPPPPLDWFDHPPEGNEKPIKIDS